MHMDETAEKGVTRRLFLGVKGSLSLRTKVMNNAIMICAYCDVKIEVKFLQLRHISSKVWLSAVLGRFR